MNTRSALQPHAPTSPKRFWNTVHVSLFSIFMACCTCFLPNEANAQQRRPLTGTVVDAATGNPLFRATVRSSKYSKKTHKDGSFELSIVRGERIEISSVGYQSRRIAYHRIKGISDLTIYLSPNSTLLANVDQTTKTELVHSKNFEGVLDHTMLGDTLAVLSFMEYRPRTQYQSDSYLHNSLSLYKYGTELVRLNLPDKSRGLFPDLFGRLWIIGDDFILRLKRSGNTFILVEEDSDLFRTRIEPITSTARNKVFYTEVMPIVPQINFYMYVAEKDTSVNIRKVRNESYFRNITSDFYDLGHFGRARTEKLSEKYGLPAELFAPYVLNDERYSAIVESKAMDAKYTSIYERPISQAFGISDKLLIFDVLNSWIFTHDATGAAVDSVSMYHHQFDGEKYRGIVQDRANGACYALHTKGGNVFLRHINPLTGGAGRAFKLAKSFPTAVRIHDGWAYYTHRTPESREYHKLYRDKLPPRRW